MISFEVWSVVQQRLLEDPGYVGARTGPDGALVLCWLPGHTPGDAGTVASELIEETGLGVRHEVNATTFAQIEEELARPMRRSELAPIYVLGSQALGPAAHEVRLTLNVATGSFARTAAHRTTIFHELAPRVPVSVVESDRPIPA